MIGGTDLTLDMAWSEDDWSFFLQRLRHLWPAAVGEGLNGTLDPFASPAETIHSGEREIFLYRDEAARLSWEEEGLTEANQADLVHVILGSHSTTFVLDAPGSALYRRIQAILLEVRANRYPHWVAALGQAARPLSGSGGLALSDTQLAWGASGPARRAA